MNGSMADLIRGISLDTGEVDAGTVMAKAIDEVIGTGDLDVIREAWIECGSDYARHVLRRPAGAAPPPGERPRSGLARRRERVTHPIFDTAMFAPDFGWFRLEEATRPMLLAVAGYRRVKAEEALRSAERVEALAGLLKNNKDTVGQRLDGDVVASLLAASQEGELQR